MNTNEELWQLIQRNVTGNATAEERAQVKIWLSQHPDNARLIEEMEKIWDLATEEDFQVNVQSSWEQFRKTRMNSRRKPVSLPSRNITGSFGHFLRVAAIILLMLGAGYIAQYFLLDTAPEVPALGFYTMEDLVTGQGEKARVTFSDGTQVILNSASSLQFPRQFDNTIREVYLEGEAYFKVAHDPDHPFIVNSQDARIEVLGTEFNIRGWSQDPSVEVVVREGKVSVKSTEYPEHEQAEVILTEGLLTTVKKGGFPEPAREVDVKYHLLWTTGGMHFDNVPLEQVIKEIERRFNVAVTLNHDELLGVPYTGTFQYAELNEILSVIAATMDLQFRRDGSQIEFM